MFRHSWEIRNIDCPVAIVVAMDFRFGRSFDRKTKTSGLAVRGNSEFCRMTNHASVETRTEDSDAGFFERSDVHFERWFWNFFSTVRNHHHVPAILHGHVMTIVSRSVFFLHPEKSNSQLMRKEILYILSAVLFVYEEWIKNVNYLFETHWIGKLGPQDRLLAPQELPHRHP